MLTRLLLARLRHRSRHLLTQLPAILPSSCALCGCTHRATICHACHLQFFSLQRLRCNQCASPLTEISSAVLLHCGNCLRHKPAFDASIVATDYAPPIDQLVLALKFGGRLALAPFFANMLHNALLLAIEQTQQAQQAQQTQAMLPTLLTTVPLGPQRLAERGFNQALEIAKPLARSLKIPLAATLTKRVHDTQAQAMLHPDARHKNMRNAFTISDRTTALIRGQHIGVVDDVITTGATLNELAATLKRFGAIRVTNIVFSRTSF